MQAKLELSAVGNLKSAPVEPRSQDAVIVSVRSVAQAYVKRLLALLCQLCMLLASFQIASHNYPHHTSDLMMKSFCLMIVAMTILWFKSTIQHVHRR